MPFRTPGLGYGKAPGGLGHAEIHQLHLPLVGDQDVLRAHVAVDDPQVAVALVQPGMGEAESGRRAQGDKGGVRKGEGPAELLGPFQDHSEVLPVDVFHDQEIAVFIFQEIDGLGDVRMGQAGGQLGLVDQHVDKVPIGGEVGMDHFHRHGFFEPARTQGLAPVDLSHPAGGDHLDENVALQAEGEIHGRASSRREAFW